MLRKWLYFLLGRLRGRVKVSPVRGVVLPWQLSIVGKSDLTFCIKCWNMKQVVFYGHQNSLHIYSYVIETKKVCTFLNALKVLQLN